MKHLILPFSSLFLPVIIIRLTAAQLRNFTGHTDSVTCLSMSSDGLHIFSGSDDRKIIQWSISSGSIVQSYTGHSSSIRSIQLGNGNSLFSSSIDGVVRQWTVSSGTGSQTFVASNLTDGSAVAASSEFVFASALDNTIKQWLIGPGSLVRSLSYHSDRIKCLLVYGEYLISGSTDSTIKSWRIRANLTTITTFAGHAGAVTSIAADSGYLFSGSLDGQIKQWVLISGNAVQSISTGASVERVAVSGEYIYVSSSSTNSVSQWSVTGGMLIRKFPAAASIISRVSSLAADSSHLFIGNSDGVIRQWCAANTYYQSNQVCAACPANSVCNQPDGFTCKAGYFKATSTGPCLTCPAKASCESGNDSFVCIPGYYKLKSQCTECPLNSICPSAADFTCNQGYYRDLAACKICPASATCYSTYFICDRGYQVSGDYCVAFNYFDFTPIVLISSVVGGFGLLAALITTIVCVLKRRGNRGQAAFGKTNSQSSTNHMLSTSGIHRNNNNNNNNNDNNNNNNNNNNDNNINSTAAIDRSQPPSIPADPESLHNESIHENPNMPRNYTEFTPRPTISRTNPTKDLANAAVASITPPSTLPRHMSLNGRPSTPRGVYNSAHDISAHGLSANQVSANVSRASSVRQLNRSIQDLQEPQTTLLSRNQTMSGRSTPQLNRSTPALSHRCTVETVDLTVESFTAAPIGAFILGRYLINGPPLQGGGHAVVRMASDEKLGQPVAIKINTKFQVGLIEIDVMRTCRSASIVALLETFELPTLPAPLIVMEQLNKSLDQFIRSRPRETVIIKGVLMQIINGLEQLHQNNYVHCDLKPQNIMYSDRDMQWKIIDFGISKIAYSEDVSGLTAMFCPPEIARKLQAGSTMKAEPSLDIWQLGMILYFMIIRTMPFEAVDDHEILKIIADLSMQISFEGVADPQAKNILPRLLAQDPKARISLAKLKSSAFFTSGLDTIQIEVALATNPKLVNDKILNKLEDISAGMEIVKATTERMLQQINATRRQLFEHSQYHCPRLMIMLPAEEAQNRWSPANWFTVPHKLYLLCEHGDTMHFTEHEGYTIREPKRFLIQAAPILSMTMGILDVGLGIFYGGLVSLPPSLFLFLSSIQRSPASKLIKYNRTDNEQQRAQKTAEYLSDYRDRFKPIVNEETGSSTSDSRLIGASLRELNATLNRIDPNQNWGELQTVSTDTGEVRFVCAEHAQEYHLFETA